MPNDIIDVETETVVYNNPADSDILPQNIFPYITPTEIIEIIKRLPNKKSPVHDLITNALMEKNPKKSNNIYIYLIQFIVKNRLFFN